MGKAPLKNRRCPYCGCNFTPQQIDQRYCGLWCEEQARIARDHGS